MSSDDDKEIVRQRLIDFTDYFVEELENNLTQCAMILEDDEDNADMSKNPAAAKFRAGRYAVTGVGAALPGPLKGIVQTFGNRVVQYLENRKNKKTAIGLSKLIYDFKRNENKAEIRKILVDGCVDIFQSYEMQLMGVTTDSGNETRAMMKFAKYAAQKVINYYAQQDNTDDFSVTIITNAIGFSENLGKENIIRKTLSNIQKPGRTVVAKIDDSKLNTEKLFTKVGLVTGESEECKYFKTKYSNTRKYGYRRLFQSEINRTEEILNECTMEDNQNEPYVYLLQEDNAEQIANTVLNYLNKKDPKLMETRLEKSMSKITNDILQELRATSEDCSKRVSINMANKEVGTVNQTVSGPSEIVNLSTNVSGGIVNQYYTRPANVSRNTSSTVINNCLAPVSSFIGREDELKHLSLLLEQHGVVVIVGMGGLGKTQLARKFVLDNTDKYISCIYWLEAVSVSSLDKSIRQLAGECNVRTKNNDTERDTVIILKDVYKKITKEMSLLIFDNVDKKDVIHNYLPHQLGFLNLKLHILITSRRTNWTRDNIPVLTLDPLPESVALDLFKAIFGTTYNETNTNHWKRLAAILGYLPLALQVASSYILQRKKVNYNFTVSDYIDQLQEGSDEILEDPLVEYENKSIYKSMMLSLDELRNGKDRKSKLAVKLLNIAAFLNPDRMWKNKLIKLIDETDAERKLDEALTTVIDFSLMHLEDMDAQEYSMHRIIQKSILYNQTENGTTDEYYASALNYAMSDLYYLESVLQYADERVSTVVKYFNEHKSDELLNYLARYKCCRTVKTIFETQDKHIVMDIINEQNLLHSAVKSESVRMVKMLCSYGAKVNLTNKNGDTALHLACYMGLLDIVQCLLDNGANPEVTNSVGKTALHKAAMRANSELVSVLLKHNRNIVDIADKWDQTPLLVLGIDFDKKDVNRNIAVARILIDNGASMLKSDNRGWTILHYAAWCGFPEYVSFILEKHKEFVHAKDVQERTPLLVLSDGIYGNDEDRMIAVARILIDNGASMLKLNRAGWTILHYAAWHAYSKYASFILQKHRELVHATNVNGCTPLLVVSGRGHRKGEDRMIAVARILIDNGASMLKSDSVGCTVLHTAAKYGYPKYASFILQKHRELVHATDVEGHTPLHVIGNADWYPYECDMPRTASILIEHGACIESKDNHGRTPLEKLEKLLGQNHDAHTDSETET